MSDHLANLKAKTAYLAARDDVVLPQNVIADWNPGGLREPLDDERLTVQDRLLGVLGDRHLGQLTFYAPSDRYPLNPDDSETSWQGEHDWICIGESEIATTTALLLHAQTGETVLYDSDAWDFEFKDNFIIVKESLAAFVDEVALGPEYRRIYYQNWAELWGLFETEDLDFPGIYGDPWYHLLREMRADLYGGPPVSRARRVELLRRIDEYFSDDEDED
ncbi:hypothetical protein AB0A73_02640 [Glycomyces sp. NPDC047369]